MAKSSNRGGGDGTCEHGGVRGTLDAPFGKGRSTGSQQTMAGPFNTPRAGGANGLPTQVYDTSMRGPGKAPAANTRDVPGTILTNPKDRKGVR